MSVPASCNIGLKRDDLRDCLISITAPTKGNGVLPVLSVLNAPPECGGEIVACNVLSEHFSSCAEKNPLQQVESSLFDRFNRKRTERGREVGLLAIHRLRHDSCPLLRKYHRLASTEEQQQPTTLEIGKSMAL